MKLLLLVLLVMLLAACQPAPAVVTPTTVMTITAEPTMTTISTTVPTTGGEPMFSAYPPAQSDEALTRGNFFVDAVELDTTNPDAVQVMVSGSLPTPCNQLRAQISPPDKENRIVIELYSVIDPGMICTQVIQPFDGVVATLAGFAPGAYQVMVNGQEAGEFVVP